MTKSVLLAACVFVIANSGFLQAQSEPPNVTPVADPASSDPEAEHGELLDGSDCLGCVEPEGPTRYFTIIEASGKFELKEVAEEQVLESRRESQAAASTVSVLEARTGQVSLTPECTTDGTSLSGARKSCTSRWSSVTAPPGFVFNERSLVKAYTGKNGSSNRIDHQWDDYVEVVPGTGIQAPRTLRVSVHARSPRCRGCRGWTKSKVTATYVAYQ